MRSLIKVSSRGICPEADAATRSGAAKRSAGEPCVPPEHLRMTSVLRAVLVRLLLTSGCIHESVCKVRLILLWCVRHAVLKP